MTQSGAENALPEAGIRIDVWLWAARFFKTRGLARQALENGKVRINDQRPKPSRRVKAGDQLQVERANEHYVIDVLDISDNRGPASVAQTLYAETADSIAKRAEQRGMRRAAASGFKPPESKPDKRARRLIRALGDIDSL